MSAKSEPRENVAPLTQAERFAEAARLAECDPDPAAFDAQLGVIAAHRPEKVEQAPAKPQKKSGKSG